MKKFLILCAVIVTIFSLTACGEITSEQEEKWQKTSLELEQLEKTLGEKVKVVSEYYDSIDNEIKKEMSPIDFTLYAVESDEILKPEKEEEFDVSYNKLQIEIEKFNEIINSVPTIEKIKEEEDVIIKRHEEIRKQEEQKKIQEREKMNEIHVHEINDTNSISPNQEINDTNSISSNQEINDANSISSSQEISEKKKIYTRYAEMGAVITDSTVSESKSYHYKRKCDSCGFMPTITYSGTSSLSSSFTCQKCKTVQKIKIKQEMTLQ